MDFSGDMVPAASVSLCGRVTDALHKVMPSTAKLHVVPALFECVLPEIELVSENWNRRY